MLYPQGAGASMSKKDSNSFEPGSPGPLLTDYTIPESYGESSLADPDGKLGADQGSRILTIGNLGSQLNFKPLDLAETGTYAAAYTGGEVQQSLRMNNNEVINYSDSFDPSNSLNLQTSPGQQTSNNNCETTYPNVTKYNDFCITDGDIPYGQVVNGKVNPRLVSRWQSYTGIYSREDALAPIDGTMYPTLTASS